jgi:hypothetical protein
MRLNAWNMSSGTVEIHAAGCSHNPESGRSKYAKQSQVEFGKADWTSKYAFAHDYWNNGILDEYEAENGEGTFDVMQEMDFKPCTKTLPDTDPTPFFSPENTDTKPAKRTRKAATKKTAEPAKPVKVRSTGSDAVAKRQAAREILYNAILAELEPHASANQDPEIQALMKAQAARVAHMFGLDKK